ncbi:MAG TPA: glycoside hydrolase family 18 protein [Anaeromyxobacteraceae bacterium]|nr:glycoside hydrolase family 18 protein [Anaeromyxobacteraceae bacterium]
MANRTRRGVWTPLLGLLALSAMPAQVAAGPAPRARSPWVTAYYAGWFWDRSPPEAIDMKAFTHLVFGRVAPGGGTLGGEPGELMPGAGTAHDRKVGPGAPERSVEDYLIARTHEAGGKVLLMLGGAGDGRGFVRSTESAGVRARFVQNLLRYLATHDYDGVDVDWEDSLDSPAQRELLLGFLRDLRAEAGLAPRFSPPRDPLLITFPGFGLNVNTDLPVSRWKVEVASLVDQYNLMTYGQGAAYAGWKTWFFSALKGEGPSTPTSVRSTVDGYVRAGVPRSKIGIGIGLYGMNYAPQPAWQASTGYQAGAVVLRGTRVYRSVRACVSGAGGPTGTGRGVEDGSCRWDFVDEMGPRRSLATVGKEGLQLNDFDWTYAVIERRYRAAGQYRWDEEAEQGYLLFPDGFQPVVPGSGASYARAGYLTFEDERSIAAKARYVREAGLGGVIVWALNYGVTDAKTGENPPLAAIRRSLLP